MSSQFDRRLAALEALEAAAHASDVLTEADALDLDDDAVIAVALEGLAAGVIRFSPGNVLRPFASNTVYLPALSYWQEICTRADVVRRARRELLMPVGIDALREVRALLEADQLVVGPRSALSPGHEMRVRLVTSTWDAASLARRPALAQLRRVLDSVQIQTGGDYCESNASALALLALLEGGCMYV